MLSPNFTNGSSGIAVGMTTNIPPHNLGELIDGACRIIDNPNVDVVHISTAAPVVPAITEGLKDRSDFHKIVRRVRKKTIHLKNGSLFMDERDGACIF